MKTFAIAAKRVLILIDMSSERPKNRIWCPDCGKPKMLFESESKAKGFIRWNAGDLDYNNGELRAYYCPACCGWHISHRVHKKSYDSQTERLITAFKKQSNGKTKIDRLIHYKDYKVQAERIYVELSDKKGLSKRAVRKWLTVYFSVHGIDDSSGFLRTAVYKLLEDSGLIVK